MSEDTSEDVLGNINIGYFCGHVDGDDLMTIADIYQEIADNHREIAGLLE